MQIHDMEQLYYALLGKLLSAEQHGLQAYDNLLEKAKSPELKKALQQHRKETEQQIQRLEQIIQKSGTSAKIEDHIVPAILREGEKMAGMIRNDELGDASLIAAAQIAEHYEIACYGTAVAHAKLLDKKDDLKLLQQTLNEEKKTDELLTQVAERSVDRKAA